MSPAAATLARAHALYQGGRYREALALLAPSLAGERASGQVLALAANAAIKLHDYERAIGCVAALLERSPGEARLRATLATLHNNRGGRRREQERPAEALSDFDRALELAPDHAQAHFNRALALLDLGRDPEAVLVLQRHLQLAPGDPAARVRLARACWRQDGAEAVSQLAHVRDPEYLEPALAVADELGRHGEPQASAAYAALAPLAAAGQRSPGLRATLGQALSLPSILPSASAVEQVRDAWRAGLARLEADWTPQFLRSCEPRLSQLAWSNFLLAYQGRDDLPLQSRFAALIGRAVEAFRPQWREPPAVPARRTARIGLLSSFWRECTVGAYFGGWIDWLADAGYEVFVYQLGPLRDATTDRLAAVAARFHFHHGDLESLVERLREDALDLLVLPELGMDPRLTPIAALRSARRQLVAWGHPVTTGFETFDGYMSCADMEPGDAAAHYCERLRTLPGLGVGYRLPELPPPTGRSDLGLPEGPLVLLPHSMFKLHPDLDPVMAELALRVPAVRYVLFEGELPQWRARFEARLGAAFTAAGAGEPALVWLARTDRSRYLAINRACDLMLDPPHFSGGNTAIDALACALPVVTSPGRFMRGRQSMAMLRRIGLDGELCAHTTAGIAGLATGVLETDGYRHELARSIGERAIELFDAEAVRARFLDLIAECLSA
ncbi:MAG TPA: tetratricopeptide repeat protein [Xanthomonadaceae bacterium]|nr:tetratricopeptide repeat protein [Xanthomonadaceae bacterium]